MYDDERTPADIWCAVFAIFLTLAIFIGGGFGIYGCDRHFSEHICEVEFTDGTVRRFKTHHSYVKGGNLEIDNDEKIRFIAPYDTWSFQIDKVKNWRKVY